MNLPIDQIYRLCKKQDKMFALIFDLPVDGFVTFEWRWIGLNDGNNYRYSKSIAISNLKQARLPQMLVADIANEDCWK